MRLPAGRGPRNMPAIEHIAMNLIRGAAGKDSLEGRGKAAAWNRRHLRALIARTAQ